MDPTAAAYQGLPQVDKAFYDRVRESQTRQLVQQFTIPIRTGQAWKVHSLLRVPTIHVFLRLENWRDADDRFQLEVFAAYQS